jgi:hypothetical protein
MTTLVVIRHLQIDDHAYSHGAELPPDLLPREVVDFHLDRRQLAEYDIADRRSLYRLLHAFSGAKEQEQLSRAELREYMSEG